MGTNVFQFNDAVDFLQSVLEEKKRRNTRFSLRAWASQLGMPHAATLSAVLNRKQDLAPELALKIRTTLKLSQGASEFYDLLVLYTNAKNPLERDVLSRHLAGMHPSAQFSTLDLDASRMIADWRYFAVLELTSQPDCSDDPDHIAKRFGSAMTPAQAKDIIDRLLRLQLVKRLDDGRLMRTTKNIATPGDNPEQALRGIHHQLLDMAKERLETMPVTAREFSANFFVGRSDQIAVIKTRMRQLRRELSQVIEDPSGDAVFVLNMSLFNVLESEDSGD